MSMFVVFDKYFQRYYLSTALCTSLARSLKFHKNIHLICSPTLLKILPRRKNTVRRRNLTFSKAYLTQQSPTASSQDFFFYLSWSLRSCIDLQRSIADFNWSALVQARDKIIESLWSKKKPQKNSCIFI